MYIKKTDLLLTKRPKGREYIAENRKRFTLTPNNVCKNSLFGSCSLLGVDFVNISSLKSQSASSVLSIFFT